MRLMCLGCDALARPIYLCAAQSPHTVDVTLLRLGLHEDPEDLRDRLQGLIDGARDQGYDAIVLAYGLCGKSTAGLVARDVPIVMPRAHDCITLFLGGRQRYKVEFDECPGTYWYALDYIERRDGTGTALSLGSGVDTDLGSVYDEYVEKYGKDNADYLMEVMGAWQDHYQRAVFIDMGIGDGAAVEGLARPFWARLSLMLAVLTLAALTVACGKSRSFTVTLKEPNVIKIVQAALDIAQVDLPLDISGVDIKDGYIRVGGSYTGEDGATTSGVVDLTLRVEDDELKAEVLNVDITGVEFTDEQIAGFNTILTTQFTKAATTVPGVRIEDVTIIEDAVKIRVRVGLSE